MNPETISLGKDQLRCPACGTHFIQFAGITPGHSQQVRKGGFFVCAHCANLSIVGDSNLEVISPQKFQELPQHVQQAVQTVIATIRDNSVRQN
jgi:hypothetical protein